MTPEQRIAHFLKNGEWPPDPDRLKLTSDDVSFLKSCGVRVNPEDIFVEQREHAPTGLRGLE